MVSDSVVEFARRDDMKYALRELDNEKLNGSRVTLEEAVSVFSLFIALVIPLRQAGSQTQKITIGT